MNLSKIECPIFLKVLNNKHFFFSLSGGLFIFLTNLKLKNTYQWIKTLFFVALKSPLFALSHKLEGR